MKTWNIKMITTREYIITIERIKNDKNGNPRFDVNLFPNYEEKNKNMILNNIMHFRVTTYNILDVSIINKHIKEWGTKNNFDWNGISEKEIERIKSL